MNETEIQKPQFVLFYVGRVFIVNKKHLRAIKRDEQDCRPSRSR